MLQKYDDLLSLTDKPPIWFDEVGVPRWCKFHPRHVNNIYAQEAALVEIACQNCGRHYKVAFSWYSWGVVGGELLNTSPMSENIQHLHYGDSPCFECSGGATMNCIDIRVLEFWKYEKIDWERVSELEVKIEN